MITPAAEPSTKRVLGFNPVYFIFTVILLVTEILIAVYVHDRFIRPYFGDVLVVILVYCFLKTFLNIRVIHAAAAALLFSYAIETLQYFDIVTRLSLEDSKYLAVMIGNSFAWEDMVAYTAGIAIVLFFEYVSRNKKPHS
jgi:hypothetical protein